MDEQNLRRLSKFLSLLLRHRPELAGLTPDTGGWVEVNTLLAALSAQGSPVTLADLQLLVSTNPKKRFAFSEDGSKIRASQGHSIAIDLGLEPTTPPAKLYHGTAEKNIASIRDAGLLPGTRTHVHLSDNIKTATEVGARHGKPVVLGIDTLRMAGAGYVFFLSANNVWLAASVPAEFIQFPS